MTFFRGRGVAALWLGTVTLAGLMAAPSSANAFCRTTTQPLPANYSPTRGCFKEGLFLYWRNACVSYSLNDNGSRTIPFEDAKRVIDASFATWMAGTCTDSGQPAGISVSNAGAATCDEVRYNPETPNQNLITFRDDGWPYNDPNSTLGLTTVTFNSETGEIYDADMEINSSARNLSVTEEVPPQGFDLASVITHEAGHFFGLAHATDSKSTMFASYKPGTTALRSLTADDIDGLCAIYPNATTRVVSQTSVQPTSLAADACDPTPRHGLTSECFVPLQPQPADGCAVAETRASSSMALLTLVAGSAFAVRRRRRRRR